MRVTVRRGGRGEPAYLPASCGAEITRRLARRLGRAVLSNSSKALQGGSFWGMSGEEDLVVRELDVYLADSKPANDGPGLVLLQYPVRSKARGEEAFTVARLRPKNQMLELGVPAVDAGPHYDAEAPDRMQLYTRKLASSRVRPATNYAVGTLDGGALYLAPLRTTYQMRPSFAYVDADTDDAHVDDRGQSATAPAPKLQAVSIKRAPTSREVAIQRTSYAFKRQEQDAEPWHELAIAHREHSGARAKRARLSVANSGQLELAAPL